ncbi:MAG: hypothetical protein ACMUIP_00515 [bacterium]
MERIEFNLLKAEIKAQIEEIKKLYKEIEDRKKHAMESRALLESLGYQLHNLYCAFEDLCKIVARHFENQIEDLARYHKELLRRLSLSIEGVRPALISEESYKELDELRAFRHFFRHAYSYELKYEKIISPLESANKLKNFYQRDIAQFLDTIEKEIE